MPTPATAVKLIAIPITVNASLLKFVTVTGSHLAAHAKIQNKYEGTINHFKLSLPSNTFENVRHQSWKILSGRFKKDVEKRRTV